MSSFRHCDVVGVTRPPCILIHNIKEAGSVWEGLSGKVIGKLEAMVQVEERCAVECTVPTSNDSEIEE